MNGEGSLEAWHPDFRIISMAMSWFDGEGKIFSDYVTGEKQIGARLRLLEPDTPLVAHNIQFEMSCAKCRFPDIRLNWCVDTMRLVQNYDNGGDEYEVRPISLDDELEAIESGEEAKPESIAGLGLAKAAQRILGVENPKKPFYEWLRANVEGCRKGNEGTHLSKLPPVLLRAYNIADTETTLNLYKFLTNFFKKISYDFRLDHRLYLSSVGFIVDAKIRGVAVRRESLATSLDGLRNELKTIEEKFMGEMAGPIKQVERIRKLNAIRKRKKLRGRKKFLKRFRDGSETARDEIIFNVGSNKQLETLFRTVLNFPMQFETAKGSPSFRAPVLHQWGPGGELLKARRKRMLIIKQCENLAALSEFDGRWHHDLRAAGTATGRYSGGAHA